MKNGIIFTTINFIINKMMYVNLVEFFKFIALKIHPNNEILASRFAVDIFIIFKWLFVIVLLMFDFQSSTLTWILWYLIFSNLYTYFYYHAWKDEILIGVFDVVRIKRRFLSLLLAIGFNVICFTYLAKVAYVTSLKWENNIVSISRALKFSVTNSLASSYKCVTPLTNTGHNLVIIQLMITFVFLTIILSNSIPQIKGIDNDSAN